MHLDNILTILGALVPLFSAASSFLNHLVRVKTSQGERPSGIVLATGAAMNLAALNIDKGVQFVKMATGKDVPQTGVIDPGAQPPSSSV